MGTTNVKLKELRMRQGDQEVLVTLDAEVESGSTMVECVTGLTAITAILGVVQYAGTVTSAFLSQIKDTTAGKATVKITAAAGKKFHVSAIGYV
jgi:hypothetical protein